jgi:glutamine amidotransferase
VVPRAAKEVKTVGILDIGISNIGSLRGSLESLGYSPVSVSNPGEVEDCERIILPGVGTFAAAMRRIREGGFLEPIRSYAESGRPLMGICLGMQLLASLGHEGGVLEGLNLVPGTVRLIAVPPGYRLPHVGWNHLSVLRPHPVIVGLKRSVDYYFVHSFAFSAAGEASVIAECEYGVRFPAIIGVRNVLGVQFHPEKSQVNGLQLLENFCEWDGAC